MYLYNLFDSQVCHVRFVNYGYSEPQFLAPQNPFWTFKYFLLWLLVRFLVTLCLFYISDNFPKEKTSILKGLLVSVYAKTTSKDSSLIFAWNVFCRVLSQCSGTSVPLLLLMLVWPIHTDMGKHLLHLTPMSLKPILSRICTGLTFIGGFYFLRDLSVLLCVNYYSHFTWDHAQGNYVFVQYIFGFDIKPNLASWSTLKVIFEVLLPRFYLPFWLPERSYN